MAWRRRLRSVSARVVRTIVVAIFFVVVFVGLILAAIQTDWVKRILRDLIVTQANEYLTATLSIGRLGGSLIRGIELGDVTVSRDGKPLIHIDDIRLAYSIRELLQRGTVIRSVRLTRPQIIAGKQADGRWDLGTLVKRESREGERTGPSRPIEVQAIEIVDGRIVLRDPVSFGAAHIPTEFSSLNAAFRFAYAPVRWTLTFDRVSWIGREPDLSVRRLAGKFGHGPTGWFFDNLSVETARSAYTLAGTIDTTKHPTVLDLRVAAPRFAFQEWSGVLRGLKNIAVESSFDTSLKGPVTALETALRLDGTGGSVKGNLTLDTSVPGWHGSGAVDVDRLNLARWLNRPDRPSDITGRVTFDLALQLGQHFPRGVYDFAGRHAMYMGYAADDVRARGQITATETLIADASGAAYGASVSVADGAIGIDAPFPFRFRGTTTHVDLRRVPKQVPVPHVESILALDYDVSGRFSEAFIVGHAQFAPSEFLGATIRGGTTGWIDTSHKPVRFGGEGDLERLSVGRFGEGLDVAWMRDPRYGGTVSGHFRVEGSGSSAVTLTLNGGGRLARADVFNGILSQADVSVDIADGTLRASYDGALAHIDPAVPFADPRFAASLNGSGRMRATVRDLLTRTTTLADYDVDGAISLIDAEVRGFRVARGELAATLANGVLSVSRAEMSGPEITGTATGSLGIAEGTESDIAYDLSRVDLARVRSLTGRDFGGILSTKGHVSGPPDALHAHGEAAVHELDADSVHALDLGGTYDAVIRPGGLAHATVRVEGQAAFLTVAAESLDQASGTITFDQRHLGFDLSLKQREGRQGTIAGAADVAPDGQSATLLDLTVALGSSPWHLVAQQPLPVVSWTAAAISVAPMAFVSGQPDERIDVSGTWQSDGGSGLHVAVHHVSLDTLAGALQQPARYGGIVDGEAVIRGTRDDPRIEASLTIDSGRVERVTYQTLAGRVDYARRDLTIDLRLDQSPGVWITAAGTVPISFFTSGRAEDPMDVAIKSSGIDLGLLEGVTSVVRNVHGNLRVDVRAVGTSADPHFDGSVKVTGAAFVANASGVPYKNGQVALTLTPDRLTVDSFHLEDANGRTLDLHGSLGTHELRIGDLQIEATANRFEVLRDEFGRIELNAALRLGGRFESPRLTGDLTLSGGDIRVDEVLQQVLFRPYATEPTAITELDPVAALNPWDRMAIDVALHVPNTLRLLGQDVQVSSGAPIGIGDINLRVLGDLYLYKDPGAALSVTGSFDRVVGAFTFQGRRFDVDPSSSINFRGDLNPDIYVTVTRVISGVEARVGIVGPLQQPELRLTSTPPLDTADILSLIVFNTSTNLLSTGQQQELLVRAATLAAGFVASPIVSAIESDIGLDVFEIEPTGDLGRGPRVTIGEEIAPGLVARFSRQFGQEPYDEATIEYYLSRLFRLRATFSDAESLSARSPFRRVERAGIDLLLFFSF